MKVRKKKKKHTNDNSTINNSTNNKNFKYSEITEYYFRKLGLIRLVSLRYFHGNINMFPNFYVFQISFFNLFLSFKHKELC